MGSKTNQERITQKRKAIPQKVTFGWLFSRAVASSFGTLQWSSAFPSRSSDILVMDKVPYFQYIISMGPFQLSRAI